MRARWLVVLMLSAVAGVGCSASRLKETKENAWSHVPQALPDGPRIYNPALPTMSKLPDPTWVGYDPSPPGYGHPLRFAGFLLHPVGVALDYALVRPFRMLTGLAPEWFGLTAEDAQKFQSHMPELVVPRDYPPRFDVY